MYGEQGQLRRDGCGLDVCRQVPGSKQTKRLLGEVVGKGERQTKNTTGAIERPRINDFCTA